MAPPFGLWQFDPQQAPRLTRDPHRSARSPHEVRLPRPPRSRLAARTFGLLALALTLFGLGGACEDKHIGRPCELGTMPLGGTSGESRRSRRPRSSARAASASCPAPRRIPVGADAANDRAQRVCTAELRGRTPTARTARQGDASNADDKRCRERLRLRLADDCRRLRLPEAVRLPRLRQRVRPAAWRSRRVCDVIDRRRCDERQLRFEGVRDVDDVGLRGRRPRRSPRRRRSGSRRRRASPRPGRGARHG